MKKLAWLSGCLGLFLFGCSSPSDGSGGASNDAGASSNPDDSGATPDSGSSSTPHDAGIDAASSAGAVSDGVENQSCTQACKTLSKHCTATCNFNDSLHGTSVGPYAGSGFYSHTTTDSSGSFTTNAMRFEASCDTVFSTTWTDNPDDPGTAYTVDSTYTSVPITCCCAP